MIATGVGTIVTGAVFLVMTNQSQTNRQQSELVEVQQNVRAAMVSIANDIADAGFGIPGNLTSAVAPQLTDSYDNHPGGDAFGTCSGTDVFTVRSRDPMGFWSLRSATPAQVVVKAGIDVATIPAPGYRDKEWPLGSTLLFFPGFGKQFTARTSQKRIANAGPATNNDQPVNLDGLQPLLADPTYVVVDSHVHLIKTSTYRVICVNDSNGVETRTLVVSHNNDSNNDTLVNQLDVDPVAADIEDLQVEFFYDNDRDDLPDASSPTGFPATTAAVERIKAVRISLVGRSSRPMQVNPSQLVGSPINIANHTWPAAPGSPPYAVLYRYGRRLLVERILLANRNTRDPTSFPYISNKWL